MENEFEELLRQMKELVKSYIKRGSLEKFKVDPSTGKVAPGKDGEGSIPGELFVILQQMLQGDNSLPPQLVKMFEYFEHQMRQAETNLTPEQLNQLQDFYSNLMQAESWREFKKAEGEKSNLDQAVQDAIKTQLRLRQSLATRIYNAWLEQNQQQEGEGEGEDGEQEDDPYQDISESSETDDGEDQDGDGDSQDGQQGENSDDQSGQQSSDGDPYQDGNMREEDFQKGYEKWLKELEEQTRDAEQENKQQQEAEAEAAAQEGQNSADADESDQDGDGQQQSVYGGAQNGSPTFELSSSDVDPKHLRIVKQAFEKLLERGSRNPTVAPRWKKRELAKRLITGRSLWPARRPTMEQKAVMFIIDNSGSMQSLEEAARAFAAALSGASGMEATDVVVATSYNGNYINTDTKRDPQAECWFLNGEYKGHLPEPPASAGVDHTYQGECWRWFVTKVLPRHRVEVRTIGIYGDNDGGYIWCYMSNVLKQLPFMWFNPRDQLGHNNAGPVIMEKSPVIVGRYGMAGAKGHGKGDLKYEKFRGLSFLRVTTADDIVRTLRRHIGN